MVDGEPLKSITKFKNGSVIFAVPNSLKAIQGKHCDVVIIDEAAIAGDFVIRDALRITASSDIDRIILSGTPLEYNSIFVDYWEQEDKYTEWQKRYHWSAMECPNIPVQKIEEAKKLPPEMYTIFWEGKPAALVNTLIPLDKLKKCSMNVRTEFNPNYNSIAGIDWGFKHETALVIVQYIDGIYYVVYENGWHNVPYEELQERIAGLLDQYKVETVYADSENISENQRLESRGYRVIPIHFKSERTRMQTRLRMLFLQERIRIDERMIKLKDQLRKYSWDTKEYDDRVDALMLAVREEEETSDVFWTVIGTSRTNI